MISRYIIVRIHMHSHKWHKYNECIGIPVKSKEIEFVGRITKMNDRMYIEIPKDSRKAFEEFSKDSLIVKVRKVLG
jgi:hypothetical protein